ncbi:MAG: hypothetical protein KDK40_02770 [Chlamydiia bacterium]|nr:hypothetical protein [Chlamydiia bacterium]
MPAETYLLSDLREGCTPREKCIPLDQEESHSQLPCPATIRKTQCYRMAFFALSLVLAVLAIVTLRTQSLTLDELTFGHGGIIQSFIGAVAAILSVGGFYLAHSLRPELEALREIDAAHRHRLDLHYQTEMVAWKYAFWKTPVDAYKDSTQFHAEHRRRLLEGARLYCHAHQILIEAHRNALLSDEVRQQCYCETLKSLKEALSQI